MTVFQKLRAAPLVCACVLFLPCVLFAQEAGGATYEVPAASGEPGVEALEAAVDVPVVPVPVPAPVTPATGEPSVESVPYSPSEPVSVEPASGMTETRTPPASAGESTDTWSPTPLEPVTHETETVQTVEVPAPEPVVETETEEEIVTVETAEAEKPAAAPKPAKAPKVKAAKEPQDPSESGAFNIGIRLGLGMSGLQGHKPLLAPGQSGLAIVMNPTVATSAGLAMAIRPPAFPDGLTIALEPQYSLYRAHGEFVLGSPDADYRDLYVAGVFLHSVELPVLMRYNFGGSVYMEAGIQPGANVYTQIYRGNQLFKPELNTFAFGAAAGIGVEFYNALLGVRGYYSFTQYDKNLNGYPWSIQVSLTKFILN